MNIIRKARISADKRSIDAYGRSVELAIATYLLDNGDFPTDISQLTIEYSGDRVECSTTQLNSDSSVYLAGCTVAGRSVEGYTYGKEQTITYDVYEVGDEVTYNNVDYYVIADSGVNEEEVQLLKKDPLTVAEVNEYGAGHVNRYTQSSVGTAYDYNGYGGMAYYSSETCGQVNGSWINTGCTTDYASSEIKYAVDAWKIAKAPTAIEARLITVDELINNFKYEIAQNCSSSGCVDEGKKSEDTPDWIYSDYRYYTSSAYNDSSRIWFIEMRSGILTYNYGVTDYFSVVRPVIVLPKSAL